ncbi:MAG: glycosyltransferase family A protein [Syntrophobacteraceae bacterium]|jgi:glycosyltransferase involved in cell wall biosynthesis
MGGPLKRISVIIPSYNAEKFLSEAIESVLHQTCPAEEIIVVDDGSVDSTVSIARSFGSSVIVIRQSNAGPSAARNAGVKNASGELIAFLDADDLWECDKLELQALYLAEHREAVAVVSSLSYFITGIYDIDEHLDDHALLSYDPIDFLAFTRFYPSTLMVRSEIAKALQFPEGIHNSEDLIYDALLRVRGRIGAVEKVLVKKRTHPEQITHNAVHFGVSLNARLDWARKNFHAINVQSASSAESAILGGAVHEVLLSYWSRNLSKFKKMRSELLSIWPSEKPVPRELTRFVPPKILLRLKDFVDGFRNKSE